MDVYICNKCFATLNRGQKPFCLTQCGHIYCYGCVQQAKKQCPQCQQVDVFALELQEPTISKVKNFFTPLTELLEMLSKVFGFQNSQMQITIQRFHEIDKKYETLKSHYYNLTQHMKVMRDKYVKLKMENSEQKKKLIELQSRSIHSLHDTSTPIKPVNQRIAKMRDLTNSSFPSCETNTLTHSFNMGKGRGMLEGFRIPYPHSMRSAGSRATSDTNSTYTFRP
ncbi:uncharacterized protein LOC143429630 [Xylocopa sonorina]|uniref:uncharacterized protein LOC143429630 n=1 Tax=Xylocopa sonorina TaxID=1818115 RepID=UPI00403AC9C9